MSQYSAIEPRFTASAGVTCAAQTRDFISGSKGASSSGNAPTSFEDLGVAFGMKSKSYREQPESGLLGKLVYGVGAGHSCEHD
jgi:hypothetical protein